RAAKQRDERAPFYLTELHLTLDEPGLRRKYIQLMRFSQEVAERFYADSRGRAGQKRSLPLSLIRKPDVT
ncbi:MAG TPA: hypothetical protein VFP38_11410, partial [Bradyrhizobium sp.]|nr:hypothetical protein [Bradyrhizobium sp.]